MCRVPPLQRLCVWYLTTGGAPVQQSMPDTTLSTLYSAGGLTIRQESQWSEVLARSVGIPFEAQNEYKVSVGTPIPLTRACYDEGRAGLGLGAHLVTELCV